MKSWNKEILECFFILLTWQIIPKINNLGLGISFFFFTVTYYPIKWEDLILLETWDIQRDISTCSTNMILHFRIFQTCPYGSHCYRGQCKCPTDCPSDYEPVCGTDGRTYNNDCWMMQQTCNNDKIVEIQSKGKEASMNSYYFFNRYYQDMNSKLFPNILR